MDSGTVRWALSVTLFVFVALLGVGMYAAQRHDDLTAVQTAVQWHAVKANNEAQRLSVYAERYFAGDEAVQLASLQTRHADLMAELKGLREGPYAKDLLTFADLETRFGTLEKELEDLGSLLKGINRTDHVALKNVRLCLENAVLALTDAVTVAVRQMSGPQTASYWGNLLNILYFSIIIAAAGLVFLAATVIAENTKNRRLADQYKEALAKADAANRAKSRLLANVSHELRTPLNAIIGFSDILRDQIFGALGNERYLEYSAHIRNSGTHLLMLVNDLLDYARHDGETSKLKLSHVDLGPLLDEAVQSVKKGTERTDVEVSLIGMPPGPVLADETAVRQITEALVANGVQNTPPEGQVEVEFHVVPDNTNGGERLTIAVLDRGPGLTPEDVDRLLHPFEMLESDSFIAGRSDRGGFSIALANKLSERLGEGVRLEGREGGGTIASFSLALLQDGSASRHR